MPNNHTRRQTLTHTNSIAQTKQTHFHKHTKTTSKETSKRTTNNTRQTPDYARMAPAILCLQWCTSNCDEILDPKIMVFLLKLVLKIIQAQTRTHTHRQTPSISFTIVSNLSTYSTTATSLKIRDFRRWASGWRMAWKRRRPSASSLADTVHSCPSPDHAN